MKALLIYNEIPEDVKFFVLELDNLETIEVLKLANGHVINFDMPDINQEACDAVCEAITKPEHATGDFDGWKGFTASMWCKNEVKVEDLPTLTGISAVFYTGFAL